MNHCSAITGLLLLLLALLPLELRAATLQYNFGKLSGELQEYCTINGANPWSKYYMSYSWGYYAPYGKSVGSNGTLTPGVDHDPYFQITNIAGYNGRYDIIDNVGYSWVYYPPALPPSSGGALGGNAAYSDLISFMTTVPDVYKPRGILYATNGDPTGIGTPLDSLWADNGDNWGRAWIVNSGGKNYIVLKMICMGIRSTGKAFSYISFTKYQVYGQTSGANYNLTVQAGTGGTVTGTAIGLATGSTPAITATANAGYEFAGWTIVSGPGALTAVALASTTFTMGAGDAVVAATFNALPPAAPVIPDGSIEAVTKPAAGYEKWFNNSSSSSATLDSTP